MNYKNIVHIIYNKPFFIYKINNVYYTEYRKFKYLSDPEHVLNINYQEINNENTDFAVIIPVGLMIKSNIEFNYTYKFLFNTKEQCIKHVDIINNKKNIINKFLLEQTDDFLKKYNK